MASGRTRRASAGSTVISRCSPASTISRRGNRNSQSHTPARTRSCPSRWTAAFFGRGRELRELAADQSGGEIGADFLLGGPQWLAGGKFAQGQPKPPRRWCWPCMIATVSAPGGGREAAAGFGVEVAGQRAAPGHGQVGPPCSGFAVPTIVMGPPEVAGPMINSASLEGATAEVSRPASLEPGLRGHLGMTVNIECRWRNYSSESALMSLVRNAPRPLEIGDIVMCWGGVTVTAV